MNYVGNLKIGTRLSAGFALVIVLLIAMAVIGVFRINAVDHNTEVILHDRFAKVVLAQNIENEVNRQSRALRTALIATEPTAVKQELAKIDESTAIIVKAVATMHGGATLATSDDGITTIAFSIADA